MIQPNGHRGRSHHRGGVVEAARFFEEAHAPHHVEDRRRNEEQARDHAAENRLRITEDDRQRATHRRLVARVRLRLAGVDGSRNSSSAAMTRPATPITVQNPVPRRARRDDRADDELPGRAAGHAEHLRRADQRRRARRGEVGGGDVDGADEREHAAGALKKASDAREVAVAGREHQRADADGGRADRDHLARPQSIERGAGDEAERRVAVVEQPDHRRDRGGGDAERLRQLRHHHRRRRAQRVLIEVVHRRDQPRYDGCCCRAAHDALPSRARRRRRVRPRTSPCISSSSPSRSAPWRSRSCRNRAAGSRESRCSRS